MIDEYIENSKHINEEMIGEHYNKKMLAQILSASLIEIKKISTKLNLPIQEITIQHIVKMIKIDKI